MSQAEASAAELAKHLSAAGTEADAARARHHQAEAAAISAAADSNEYAKAAEQAAQAQAAVAAANDRVRRLEHAHREAAAREQTEYLARLDQQLQAAKEAHAKAHCQAGAELKAEEDRHVAAVAEIELRRRLAEGQVVNVANRISRARSGMSETAEKRVAELRRKQEIIRQQYGEKLDEVVGEASNRYSAAQARVRECDALNRQHGGHGGQLAEACKEQDTAGRILQDNRDQQRKRNGEIAELQREIDELERVLQR